MYEARSWCLVGGLHSFTGVLADELPCVLPYPFTTNFSLPIPFTFADVGVTKLRGVPTCDAGVETRDAGVGARDVGVVARDVGVVARDVDVPLSFVGKSLF